MSAVLSFYRRVVPERIRALVPGRLRAAVRRLFSPRPTTDTTPDGSLRTAMAHAEAASRAQDWPEAVARWAAVLAQTGEAAPARVYQRLGRAHRGLGHLGDAEKMLATGLTRHPDDIGLASEHAELAMAQRDWPEAVRRWAAVLDRPAPPGAFRKASRSLRRLGRLDDASDAVRRGLAAHPDDLRLATEFAELATAERDWPEAATRWEALLDRFGDAAPTTAYIQASQSLAENGRFEAAENVLARGLAIRPGAVSLALERVCLAAMYEGGTPAGTLLEAVVAEHGDSITPDLYVNVARRLLTAFEYDAADAAVAAGLAAHPDEPTLLRQHVRNAITRERRTSAPEDWDWTEALRRSRAVLRRSAGTERDHLDLSRDISDATAHAEAKELLRDGLERHPGSRLLQAELATLSMAGAEWGEAALRWRTLLDGSGGESVGLRIKLSRTYRSLADYDTARSLVDEGRQRHPRDARLVVEAAEIESERGDHAATVEVLEPLVTSATPTAQVGAYRKLALAYRLLGADEEAARVLGAARLQHPDTMEANPGVVAIIGGGPSLRGTDLEPLRGQVHTVGVNATYLALPWVSQTVTHDPSHLTERFSDCPGPVLAAVPIGYLEKLGRLPSIELRRRIISDRLSETDDVMHSGGHTSAYTALNYAYLLRPYKLVLFGIDLTGFWGPNDSWHQQMDAYNRRKFASLERRPSFDQFVEYRSRKLRNSSTVFASAVPQLERSNIRVINASPVSSLDCFEKVTPEEGIAHCLEPVRSSAA